MIAVFQELFHILQQHVRSAIRVAAVSDASLLDIVTVLIRTSNSLNRRCNTRLIAAATGKPESVVASESFERYKMSVDHFTQEMEDQERALRNQRLEEAKTRRQKHLKKKGVSMTAMITTSPLLIQQGFQHELAANHLSSRMDSVSSYSETASDFPDMAMFSTAGASDPFDLAAAELVSSDK